MYYMFFLYGFNAILAACRRVLILRSNGLILKGVYVFFAEKSDPEVANLKCPIIYAAERMILRRGTTDDQRSAVIRIRPTGR